MNYQSKISSGAWVNSSDLDDVLTAKIVSETKPQKSSFKNKDGSPKIQDVCKVKFESSEESVNISLNRATINGLVDAFGEDSVKWQGHVLSVETEKMRVGGVARVAIYLIPEGFKRVDDDNGYAVITKIEGSAEKDVNSDIQNEVNVEDIPVAEPAL